MAATGAYTVYDATSNREDLSAEISMIDPTITPIFSRIRSVDASNTNHEWQTQALATAVDTNAHVEGVDFTGEVSIPTVRPRNICQIVKKEPVVSGSQQKGADHAGIQNMMDKQVFLRMEEIPRDIEMSFTANKGLVVGNATTARVMRGLGSWMSTNVNAVGADAVAETAGRTDGAQRAFTITLLEDVEAQCNTSGGRPSMLSVAGTKKQTVAGFIGRTSARQNVGAATIQANVDVFAGNYFQLEIIHNHFQRARDAFVLEPGKLAKAFFRTIANEEIGKQGDNVKSQVVGELTLRVDNEAAHGGIFDLT